MNVPTQNRPLQALGWVRVPSTVWPNRAVTLTFTDNAANKVRQLIDEEGNPEPEQPTEGESEIRSLVEERLKKMAGGDQNDDEEEG